MEMVLIDDMMRPHLLVGRDASACRLVGRSHSPCGEFPALHHGCQAGAVASVRASRYIRRDSGVERCSGGSSMRAEIENTVDEIRQSVGLLRRHL
jgi:hypothetical protein